MLRERSLWRSRSFGSGCATGQIGRDAGQSAEHNLTPAVLQAETTTSSATVAGRRVRRLQADADMRSSSVVWWDREDMTRRMEEGLGSNMEMAHVADEAIMGLLASAEHHEATDALGQVIEVHHAESADPLAVLETLPSTQTGRSSWPCLRPNKFVGSRPLMPEGRLLWERSRRFGSCAARRWPP